MQSSLAKKGLRREHDLSRDSANTSTIKVSNPSYYEPAGHHSKSSEMRLSNGSFIRNNKISIFDEFPKEKSFIVDNNSSQKGEHNPLRINENLSRGIS